MTTYLYRCGQCGKSHDTIKGAMSCSCTPRDCHHDSMMYGTSTWKCWGCDAQVTEIRQGVQ